MHHVTLPVLILSLWAKVAQAEAPETLGTDCEGGDPLACASLADVLVDAWAQAEGAAAERLGASAPHRLWAARSLRKRACSQGDVDSCAWLADFFEPTAETRCELGDDSACAKISIERRRDVCVEDGQLRASCFPYPVVTVLPSLGSCGLTTWGAASGELVVDGGSQRHWYQGPVLDDYGAGSTSADQLVLVGRVATRGYTPVYAPNIEGIVAGKNGATKFSLDGTGVTRWRIEAGKIIAKRDGAREWVATPGLGAGWKLWDGRFKLKGGEVLARDGHVFANGLDLGEGRLVGEIGDGLAIARKDAVLIFGWDGTPKASIPARDPSQACTGPDGLLAVDRVVMATGDRKRFDQAGLDHLKVALESPRARASGGELSGTATFGGAPLPEAPVVAVALEGPEAGKIIDKGVTDKAGRFVFRGLPDLFQWEVRVEAPGLMLVGTATDQTVRAGKPMSFEGKELTGAVVDDRGQPRAGAPVRVGAYTFRTDDAGRFRASVPAATKVYVGVGNGQVATVGLGGPATVGPRDGVTPTSVRIARCDGAPAAGWSLRYVSYQGLTDDEGRWILPAGSLSAGESLDRSRLNATSPDGIEYAIDPTPRPNGILFLKCRVKVPVNEPRDADLVAQFTGVRPPLGGIAEIDAPSGSPRRTFRVGDRFWTATLEVTQDGPVAPVWTEVASHRVRLTDNGLPVPLVQLFLELGDGETLSVRTDASGTVTLPDGIAVKSAGGLSDYVVHLESGLVEPAAAVTRRSWESPSTVAWSRTGKGPMIQYSEADHPLVVQLRVARVKPGESLNGILGAGIPGSQTIEGVPYKAVDSGRDLGKLVRDTAPYPVMVQRAEGEAGFLYAPVWRCGPHDPCPFDAPVRRAVPGRPVLDGNWERVDLIRERALAALALRLQGASPEARVQTILSELSHPAERVRVLALLRATLPSDRKLSRTPPTIEPLVYTGPEALTGVELSKRRTLAVDGETVVVVEKGLAVGVYRKVK